MGSIKKPTKRSYWATDIKDVVNLIEDLKRLSNSQNLPFEHILRVYELLEHQRTNNLSIQEGNIKDEKAMGFADLIEEHNGKMSELLMLLENKFA